MSHSNFPLLEYDPDPRAVLEPGHDAPGLRLPENCAFPFLGETVADYAREHRLPVLGEFVTITKRLPVYRVTETLCLCEAPMGAPVAASCLDWLIACGVRRVVAAGSCGALVDLPENAFVLPKRALRDEGTSFHYLPAARWIDLDGDVRGQIEGVFAAEGLPFVETDTWTTDAIFRETAEKIGRWSARRWRRWRGSAARSSASSSTPRTAWPTRRPTTNGTGARIRWPRRFGCA